MTRDGPGGQLRVWLKVVWTRPVATSVAQQRQGVGIGALEFRELAILQDFAGDQMLFSQFFQDVNGSGNDFFFADLERRGQIHIFCVGNLAQLLQDENLC